MKTAKKHTKNNKSRRIRGIDQRKALVGYLFCLPWLIGFIAFTAWPLISSFRMSLNRVGIGAHGLELTYVGVDNFVYSLTMDLPFLTGLIESIRFVAILTPLIIVLSLIIGLLLHATKRFKGLFRALYFLPVIIVSGSLITILTNNGVFDIVSPNDEGLFRWIYSAGLGPVAFVIEFLISNIFNVLWFSGVQILIYLSGLQKGNPSIYEAASIDGATAWQCFWKITLPSLSQFTILNVLYTVTMLATFPNNPVILSIRENMFHPRTGLGYSSALSWIYLIVILVILFTYLTLAGLRPGRRKGV